MVSAEGSYWLKSLCERGDWLRSYKAFAARERITAHEFAAIPNLLPWRRKQS
jgi:hypothetical protein